MSRYIFAAMAIIVAGLSAYVLLPVQTPSPDLLGAALAASDDDGAIQADVSTIAEMSLGNPDAPVTVIEYASYTCPHCARFHQAPFQELKANYIDTGKIHFIYREVYFDRFGLWASAIARCGGPEKFFGITDLIYQGQSDWARGSDPAQIAENLRKIGRLAGLDNIAIDACLKDNAKLRTLVAWYQENATRDDISSTPSFVINGTKYSNLPYPQLAQTIDEAQTK